MADIIVMGSTNMDLVLESEGTKTYFEKPYLEKVWNQHQSGVRDWSAEIWGVMMFNLWHRRFVEQSAVAATV